VSKAAEAAYRQGMAVAPAALMPVYLRPAQAERSLKKRKGETK
jgi:tRNA threonylcarbamoyladenosine biosynthesis protein TsaB